MGTGMEKNLRGMKSSRETEKQREQEPANWVLCRLAVCLVHLWFCSAFLNRPLQATWSTAAPSHRREQVCVCVCVRWSLFQQGMFTHPCLLHPTALSLCTAWSGFMDALRAFAWLVHFRNHSFPTTHFNSAADSRHIPYRRWSQRSRRTAGIQSEENQKENRPGEELTARKHRIINLPSCVFFLSTCRCVSVCVSWPVILAFTSNWRDLPLTSPGASVDTCVCVTRSCGVAV